MKLFKFKILFVTFFLLFCSDVSISQYALEWTRRYPESGPNSAFLSNMTLDKNENLFLIGGGLTLKYASNGSLDWTLYDSSTFVNYTSVSSDLTTDDSGNVFVTGTATNNPFDLDFLTKKISTSGIRLWSNTYGNSHGASDRSSGIINFRNKFIFVAGSESYGDSAGSCNFKWTVIKYDLYGNPLMNIQFCGISDYVLGDYAPVPSMAIDSSGNIIISGSDKDILTFNNQMVTIKYDSTGNLLWLRRLDNVYPAYAVAADANSNIFVGIDGGILKYDDDGDLIWSDYSHSSDFIAFDSIGNLVTSGDKQVNNVYRIVTSKYDTSGNLIWSSETNTGFYIASMCLNKNGKAFIAANGRGNFYGMYHMYVYDINGSLIWNGSYDDQVDTLSIPVKIAADEYDNFYITGRSYGIGVWARFLTLKYSKITNIVNTVSNFPNEFKLHNNYPNPFNPTTNLEFGISELGFVTLKVYDVSGKEVMTLVNEQKAPGYYTVSFNGANLSSGIYFYSIKAGDFVSTKKMTLLK